MTVGLVWITPDAEKHLLSIAKVSNPERQHEPSPRLIRYLIEHGHWSPFEMVNLCIEVETTRDIGRQMLRHWTMRPQEFSQRYADVGALGEPVYRECRMQHPTNRQASVPCEDRGLALWWQARQEHVWRETQEVYRLATQRGIAKEVARAVLPEGLTPTRMYFNTHLRTAIHFCQLRTLAHGAQKEIVEVADGVRALIKDHLPTVWEAVKERA